MRSPVTTPASVVGRLPACYGGGGGVSTREGEKVPATSCAFRYASSRGVDRSLSSPRASPPVSSFPLSSTHHVAMTIEKATRPCLFSPPKARELLRRSGFRPTLLRNKAASFRGGTEPTAKPGSWRHDWPDSDSECVWEGDTAV